MMLVHLMVYSTDLVEWGIFTLFLIKKKSCLLWSIEISRLLWVSVIKHTPRPAIGKFHFPVSTYAIFSLYICKWGIFAVPQL